MGVGGGCRSSPLARVRRFTRVLVLPLMASRWGVGVRLARALAPELMPTALTWGPASLL